MTETAGFLLASKWHIDFWLLISTLVGTSLVIASGCVFNNYIDRDIDKKMARTKKRALVIGAISGRSAIIYGFCLAIAGFLILSYTNLLTMLIGLGAILSYVFLYGIAKRRTVYGTLVGTIPGAASLLAGYTAVTNRLDTEALVLFLIMVVWQMPHFYAIAMYRFKDYKTAGLPVLPVVKGMRRTKLEILFYVGLFIISTSMLTILGYTGIVFLIIVAGLGCYWFMRGLQGFKAKDDNKWSRQMFSLSLVVLLSLSVMLSVGALLP